MHLDMLHGGNTVETVASVDASKGLPERAMTPTWLPRARRCMENCVLDRLCVSTVRGGHVRAVH